jgi:predicted secreted protein
MEALVTSAGRQGATAEIADERGGEVVFVAHCLLNENTRYAGGAFRRGMVGELVEEIQRRGWGIVQMPCPEQVVWGGVRKRHLGRVYGTRGSLAYRFRRPLVRIAVGWTTVRYSALARAVVRQIEDYLRSGMRVVGIVGVGASPSCGVTTTLEIGRAVEVLAACPLAGADRDRMNDDLLIGCSAAGEGLFIGALRRRLAKRGIDVPFFEHDLVAEMRGGRQDVLPQAL